VEGDWRADLQRRLAVKPSNQARLVPAYVPFLYEDRMAFRSDPELSVYRAVRRAQASLPPHETIGILPNPCMRIAGNTWEPDNLVTYKNRVGVIEVDGPHHRQRWAADNTKDNLYEDAGVAYVQRITVEDTESPVVTASSSGSSNGSGKRASRRAWRRVMSDQEYERRLEVIPVSDLPYAHNPFLCEHADRFVEPDDHSAEAEVAAGKAFFESLGPDDFASCPYHKAHWPAVAQAAIEVLDRGLDAEESWYGTIDAVAREFRLNDENGLRL
jgi:hypothetical protein